MQYKQQQQKKPLPKTPKTKHKNPNKQKQNNKKIKKQHQTHTLFNTETAIFNTSSFQRTGSILVSYCGLLDCLHVNGIFVFSPYAL